jgi:5S rRNA maturation endonuclease (ribonuclease M5)
VAFQLEGTRFRDLNTDGRARVAEWSRGFTGTSLVTYLSPLAAEPAPITYPPDHQVRALWRRGTPVCGPVADYLAGRRIDPGAVADRDLARVLPVDGLPPWASLGGRSWADTGHHLLVPCFDERGAMCSLLARNTRGGAPKSLGPSGYGRRGLIMADSLARQLLHDGERPEWFGEHEVRIAIAEGEIDFLLAATAAGDADEYAHASLGIFSGSLTDQIAARIPYGSKIIIATDHDEQGERYARSIAQALRSARRHLDLRRWQPIQGGVS